MGNVVRLVSGGQVQVRTGVLQGVGPQGPRGQVGPAGPDGPEGPQGGTGAAGAISVYAAEFYISTTLGISADTNTLVSFAGVDHDDISAHTSSTNFTLVDAGDYLITAWLTFSLGSNAGDSLRSLWLTRAGGATVVTRSACLAVADDITALNITHRLRSGGSEVLNLYARHSDDVALSIAEGRMSITRVGSGAVGPLGPAGPAGSVGPAGPTGATGATGSGGGTYAHYSNLHV